MKTHVLTFAKTFMSGHPREGEKTFFRESIIAGQKIHTIRSNFDYWAYRMYQLQRGEARLSLREWKGKPYQSKQREFWEITHAHGAGFQTIYIDYDFNLIVQNRKVGIKDLAQNDGLSKDDLLAWFHPNFEGIIIHFTDFRYDPAKTSR